MTFYFLKLKYIQKIKTFKINIILLQVNSANDKIVRYQPPETYPVRLLQTDLNPDYNLLVILLSLYASKNYEMSN